MNYKAFTLVELIIVIAIIAILAAGLLAGLDPMEQIAKSQDTATEAAMKELKSAIDRYMVGNGHFPGQLASWTPSQAIFTSLDHNSYLGGDQHILNGQGTPETAGLGATSELKQSLVKTLLAKDTEIFLMPTSQGGLSGYVDGDIICMKPKSKQFKQKALYSATVGAYGTPPQEDATCPGATNCYVCIE